MSKYLPENLRSVVYSFLNSEDLLDKISKLSAKERSMLVTKYSEILNFKKELHVFERIYPDIE